MEQTDRIRIIKVNNANNIIDYWERNMYDSNIYLELIDFDEVEISLDDMYDGDINDAIETIESIQFSARL